MSVLNEKSVFTSLNQRGPLAVRDLVDLDRPFSPQGREWVKTLNLSELNVTKYRALRRQVFEFLDISSFREISQLLADSEAREKCSRRAFILLGNMFGISGTPDYFYLSYTVQLNDGVSIYKERGVFALFGLCRTIFAKKTYRVLRVCAVQ